MRSAPSLRLEWRGQSHVHELDAGIPVTEPGIRDVVKTDAQPAIIGKSIIEFRAGAKFPPIVEIDSVPTLGISAGETRRDYEIVGDVDIETEPDIGINGPFSGAHRADKGRQDPPLVAEPELA